MTKDELKEALKDVGGIATDGLLTEVKAEETYAKKSEAVDNTNFELVKNRVLALELKSDKDTVYDDSGVKERLTTLENKQPVDLSNYATKEELRNVSGSQPNVDNLVTKEELEAKHYISDVSNLATKEELQEVRNSQPTVDTSHLVTRDELESKGYVTDLSEYAKKSELYNDSDLKARVEVLEQKTDKDTVYDDTPLKERVTALESKAIEGGAYDDKPIRDRLDVLEAKHDNDTIYDDTEVKRRLTEIESKPAVDTSVFVTDEKLAEKGYLTQHQSLENVVTKEELNNKGYLTQHQDISNLATKEELAKVVTKDELEAKHFVTDEVLNSKQYLTEDVLNSKNYLTTHQSLENLVTKDELENKGYLTTHQSLENYALKSEIPTPYNDSEVKQRLGVLEAKQDKDTIYDDTPLKERVTALENKPNVDLSNYVTTEQLENKHYLTQHQPLDNLVTKEELSTKGYITEEVLNGKNYLTEDVLNTKNYLTQHQDLSSLVTKQELENKHFLTEHQPLTHLATTSDLEALRNVSVSKSELSKKLDTTEYNSFKDIVVTKDELASKGYLTTHQDISNLATKQEVEATYAKKTDLPTPYNDSELVQKIGQLEARVDKDTVYDDSEVKRRLTELEARPTGTSYNDKPLSDRVKALEDTPKVDVTEYNSFKESTATNVLSVRDRLGRLEKSILSNNNSLSSQTLALTNNILSISGGNSVELPVNKSEMRGTGMPNGVVEAEIGTTYVDKNKTNGALKWIKTTDGGNTGWKVAEGDTGWVLGWQVDKGDNKNRMYFRRKNDVVHVKFEPEINSTSISPETNLILNSGGDGFDEPLTIDGFKPVDDVVQTIFKTVNTIYSEIAGAENSKGAQGTGVVIIQYEYYRHDKTGLKLQIVTSELGVEENHVNPFSYLTEDEWPTQLP